MINCFNCIPMDKSGMQYMWSILHSCKCDRYGASRRVKYLYIFWLIALHLKIIASWVGCDSQPNYHYVHVWNMGMPFVFREMIYLDNEHKSC